MNLHIHLNLLCTKKLADLITFLCCLGFKSKQKKTQCDINTQEDVTEYKVTYTDRV